MQKNDKIIGVILTLVSVVMTFVSFILLKVSVFSVNGEKYSLIDSFFKEISYTYSNLTEFVVLYVSVVVPLILITVIFMIVRIVFSIKKMVAGKADTNYGFKANMYVITELLLFLMCIWAGIGLYAGNMAATEEESIVNWVSDYKIMPVWGVLMVIQVIICLIAYVMSIITMIQLKKADMQYAVNVVLGSSLYLLGIGTMLVLLHMNILSVTGRVPYNSRTVDYSLAGIPHLMNLSVNGGWLGNYLDWNLFLILAMPFLLLLVNILNMSVEVFGMTEKNPETILNDICNVVLILLAIIIASDTPRQVGYAARYSFSYQSVEFPFINENEARVIVRASSGTAVTMVIVLAVLMLVVSVVRHILQYVTKNNR